MIKNVKSVHIPNAEGKVGIETAVAMGALLGCSAKKLMVIADVDHSRLDEVYQYAESGLIKVHFQKDCPKLYIRIEAEDVLVEITDFHTHVNRYSRAGVSLLSESDASCSDSVKKEELTDRSFLTIDNICHHSTGKNRAPFQQGHRAQHGDCARRSSRRLWNLHRQDHSRGNR